MSSYYDFYPPYESQADKLKKALKMYDKLKKKNPNLSPISVEGKIVKTWWGKSWCSNLEKYEVYRHRLDRGRSYLRAGMVLDLQIEKGLVKSLVVGSGRNPYEIEIKIDLLGKDLEKKIIDAAQNKIESLEQLLLGQFPKELGDLFLNQDDGIFPSPKEIHFICNCLDYADMCKHCAAALYGVGARLDKDPLLFFKLRGIDFNVFLKRTLEGKLSLLLQNADKKTGRVIEGCDIGKVFTL
ncbi:MAG: hypothetical protein LBH25_05200 [Fibromonadaceae bacterium]|nr:hypothetical protein [Fibromonadaceae bacterium]